MTVREFWNTTTRETMIRLIDGSVIGWANGNIKAAIVDNYRNYTDLSIFGDLQVTRIIAASKNRIDLVVKVED